MFKYEVCYKDIGTGLYSSGSRMTNDYIWFKRIIADCGEHITMILINNKVVWDCRNDSIDKIEKVA